MKKSSEYSIYQNFHALKKTLHVPVDDRHPIESSEPSEGVEKPGHTEGCTQVLKTGYRLFPQERHATLRGCVQVRVLVISYKRSYSLKKTLL